jgi:non-specific serine/threonine protein kinase
LPDERIRLVTASGACEIDLARRELRVLGSPVPVGGRAFEIIEVLARSAGELVTKNELIDRIWPGAIVAENTLHVHAVAIRKALGPNRGLLKTESGRGYRLLGDWTVRRQETAKPPVGLQRMRVDGEPPVTNLPVTVTRLVGRTAAVAQLRDLLSAYRVVTLTGPGGIGKTSLALMVARGIVGEFTDGVWLVELASLTDPALLPSIAAQVLRLGLGAERISAEIVARGIGAQKLLLFLDNCEHVIGPAAEFVDILVRMCQNVTILVTSREILRIEGEHVYRVSSLEVPAAGRDDADYILSHSAVELFIARTKASDMGFSPHAGELPSIGAICRQLDGIPLAIEFAAARTALLGVQQVAVGLRDRFALLKTGRRTALPRHRTLRAALDWSYELLPEAEKRLLHRLAIFSGGLTLAAAAAVMNDFSGDASAITDGIANLVEKSLLAFDRSEAETRWYLLETTRAYALEKLAESGESGPTARRHTEFYQTLFTSFATEGRTAVVNNLGRYRRETDNLRAALNWAFSSDGDAAMGVAVAGAAADFWLAASLVAEASEWSSKALARIGDAAGTRCEMALQHNLGRALTHTHGMTDGAHAALTRAMTLARDHADIDRQQRVTVSFWLFSVKAAALHDALASARQYEEVARLADPQSRALADWLICIPQIYLGEHIEASERFQRADDQYPIASRGRDIVRFMGDFCTVTYSHFSISLLSQGHLDAAAKMAMRAIEEARFTNQPTTFSISVTSAAGFVFLGRGELDVAERYSDGLIDHAYRFALRPYYAIGNCVRGSLAVRRADPNVGIDWIRRGLAEMREVGHLVFYPYFLAELAAALGAIGRIDDGLAEIDTALRVAAEMSHRWIMPEILRVKGELLALRGSDDLAVIEDLFRESMSLAHEQQALYWELSTAISLAEMLRGDHREAEARAVLAPVYDRFAEGLATVKPHRAKTLLNQFS